MIRFGFWGEAYLKKQEKKSFSLASASENRQPFFFSFFMINENAPKEPACKISSHSLGQNVLCIAWQNKVNCQCDKTFKKALHGKKGESSK